MSVKVSFVYDEDSRNWAVEIEGAVDSTEAKQAFNAVILSCREVTVGLKHRLTLIREDVWELFPTT